MLHPFSTSIFPLYHLVARLLRLQKCLVTNYLQEAVLHRMHATQMLNHLVDFFAFSRDHGGISYGLSHSYGSNLQELESFLLMHRYKCSKQHSNLFLVEDHFVWVHCTVEQHLESSRQKDLWEASCNLEGYLTILVEILVRRNSFFLFF